jgi:hypothetical protein
LVASGIWIIPYTAFARGPDPPLLCGSGRERRTDEMCESPERFDRQGLSTEERRRAILPRAQGEPRIDPYADLRPAGVTR